MLDYTTPHTPQLNSIIERISAFIKEGSLSMLLNLKLNDTYQKTLWSDSVHTWERVQKIMATIGSMKSLFENFYGEKPNIIGLFSEVGRITCITKRKNIKKQMKEKI